MSARLQDVSDTRIGSGNRKGVTGCWLKANPNRKKETGREMAHICAYYIYIIYAHDAVEK